MKNFSKIASIRTLMALLGIFLMTAAVLTTGCKVEYSKLEKHLVKTKKGLSPEKPYTVKLKPTNLTDNWPVINQALVKGAKYVILDLVDCTATDNTIGWPMSNKYLKGIVLPSTLTSIGEAAFKDCTGLTTITIPNGVTSIGNSAFEGCTGLTSVTIPDGVTSIGVEAFAGTGWFAEQPDGVVYVGKILYKYKGDMPEGTSITIEPGTVAIVARAFAGCDGLTAVTIPDSVTSIGSQAFGYCTALTSVTIPNSVTTIDGLTTTTIPAVATSADRNPFEGTPWYSKIEGLVYIGKVLYGYKGKMPPNTSITIVPGTVSIRDEAFLNGTVYLGYRGGGFFGSSDCYGLTSVTIPDSVTSIGAGAFAGCEGLTSITIPDSVTSIGYGAFIRCTGLTSVKIPNGLTKIEGWTFSRSGLTSVAIPTSVTSIGQDAFWGCNSLASIEIPDSVTSIGAGAFVSTAWYDKQPNGLVYIGKVLHTYKGKMPANTSITIAPGTVALSDYAFSDCTGLTSVTIPDSVLSIGGGAFYNTRINEKPGPVLKSDLDLVLWVILMRSNTFSNQSTKTSWAASGLGTRWCL